MADLTTLKALSKAREQDEKRAQERRRNTLVLIMRHLVDNGYVEAYERLSAESNLSLNRADVADNMDLEHIVQEFEEAFEAKYNKRPKLVKRMVEEVATGGGGVRLSPLVKPPRPGSTGSSYGGPASPAPRTDVAGGQDGPPVSGAMAARLRRERAAAAATGSSGASTPTVEDARKAEQLERRRLAMNSVAPPPELGAQTVAGVTIDGRGPVLKGGGGGGGGAVGPSGRGSNDSAMRVQGTTLRRTSSARGDDSDSDPDEHFERRLLKPLPASLQVRRATCVAAPFFSHSLLLSPTRPC